MPQENDASTSASMKIFISWSGKRSGRLAKTLYDWLPLVLHYAEPWLSGSDVKAGERWSAKVAENLQESQFGILCLTSDNVSAPWILYEAGAIGKFVSDSAVCPYLLDLDFKDLPGPLSQFQAKKAEREATFELIEAIDAHSGRSMPKERLRPLFDALWPSFCEKVQVIGASSDRRVNLRSTEEILEDLVVSVRAIERRLTTLETHQGPGGEEALEGKVPGERHVIECRKCFEIFDCCLRNCPECGAPAECT